jgi:Toastrack DUF4097
MCAKGAASAAPAMLSRRNRVRKCLLSLAILLLGLPGRGWSETTRTLRVELKNPSAAFAVENLAGRMRITAGSGDAVVAVATLHAESDDWAAAVRFEEVSGEHGVPTLRVRYPLDRETHYRYPGSKERFSGHSETRYEGRRVRVSGNSGILLYADVDVQVPRRGVEAKFRNAFGPMEAAGLEGTLAFDTGSGRLDLEDLRGDILADTGSGDVKAALLEGSFRCDTGSGECDITGFRGDRLSLDSGSGDVRVKDVHAKRLAADTGSGTVKVAAAEVEELTLDTGSGDVEVEAAGATLARVKADTGSGTVKLRLGPEATFEARASLGSGDIVNRYPDAQPILRKREVVGYRRGDARIRIDVDTGSGDLVLEPGPPR